MLRKIYKKLNTRFPQNFILKYPFYGSVIYMVFTIIFTTTYMPLKTHPSLNLSYGATMAIYMSASGTGIYVFIHILKAIPYFSPKYEWTFMKEILSIIFILIGSGIFLYLMGFFMEEPSDRWNLATLINSCEIGFLIGIFPLGFFTLVHYRHLFLGETSVEYKPDTVPGHNSKKEEKIQITSRLKKEELSFFPDELIYAESEGNYVAFHLSDGIRSRKELIRNSMNEIEQQLTTVTYFTRIHRAFIINVKKVKSRKGNTLGYRLKLHGTEEEIPVSRPNVQSFDRIIDLFDQGKATMYS